MFFNEVKKIFTKYNMIHETKPLLIGVSGGVDSVVLCNIIAKILDNEKNRIVFCHVNYSLRGDESDRDENFVKKLAQTLQIKLENIKINMPEVIKETSGGSIQNLARQARFDFFKKVSEKYNSNYIYLGHNLNDLCETFLMRLLRGSGTHGLSSIDFTGEVEGLKLFRPLLAFTRTEIEKYAANKKIEFVEDSSNIHVKYDRNKIRHHLIPLIERELNPNIVKTLLMVTDIIKTDESYFKEIIAEVKKSIVVDSDQNSTTINLKNFNDLHIALKSRIIRDLIKELKGNIYNISYVNIIDILHIASSKEKRKTIQLPDGMKAEKINLRLKIF